MPVTKRNLSMDAGLERYTCFIDKSTGSSHYLMLNRGSRFKVTAVYVQVIEIFATADCDVDVGYYGALTAVVNNFTTGSTTTAAGTLKTATLVTSTGVIVPKDKALIVTNNVAAGTGTMVVTVEGYSLDDRPTPLQGA